MHEKLKETHSWTRRVWAKVFIFSSSVHMFLFRASAWWLYLSALYARAIRKDWEALIQWSSWDNKWGMVCMVQSSEPFSLLTTIDIEIFYNTLRVDVDWNGEETMNELLELHGRNSKFLHESWLFFFFAKYSNDDGIYQLICAHTRANQGSRENRNEQFLRSTSMGFPFQIVLTAVRDLNDPLQRSLQAWTGQQTFLFRPPVRLKVSSWMFISEKRKKTTRNIIKISKLGSSVRFLVFVSNFFVASPYRTYRIIR